MQRPVSESLVLLDYQYLAILIYNFERDDEADAMLADGRMVFADSKSSADKSKQLRKPPLHWRHLTTNPQQLKYLDDILKDPDIMALAHDIAHPDILDKILAIDEEDLNLIFKLKVSNPHLAMFIFNCEVNNKSYQLRNAKLKWKHLIDKPLQLNRL